MKKFLVIFIILFIVSFSFNLYFIVEYNRIKSNNDMINHERNDSMEVNKEKNNLWDAIYTAEKNTESFSVKYTLYFYTNGTMAINTGGGSSFSGTYSYNPTLNTLLLSYMWNGKMESFNCSVNENKTIIHHPGLNVDFQRNN